MAKPIAAIKSLVGIEMFSSLSKPFTATWLSVSEWSLLLFGAVLVAGLIGEFLAGHKGKKYSRLKKRKRFFEMLVIVGVLGELLADGGIFLFGNQLQRISDRENSIMIGVAAKAEKEAGIANEHAANTESNNLVLQAKVLELESKQQWREISDAKKQDLIACLKTIPKGKVFICTGFAEQEPIQYGNQIAEVLTNAGFSVQKYGDNNILSVGLVGLAITWPDPSNPPIFGPLLRICFSNNGIPMDGKLPTGFNLESNSVCICVGGRF